MTRAQYMNMAGITFENCKDKDSYADNEFMESIDRIAVAVGAFESSYCQDCEENKA